MRVIDRDVGIKVGVIIERVDEADNSQDCVTDLLGIRPQKQDRFVKHYLFPNRP